MDMVPERKVQRWSTQRLESITRWTPTLWSIRTSKPDGFRFMPGHYARLGLVIDQSASTDASAAGTDVVWRPYSIVSSPSENFLEFLITLIPGGAFTSKLAQLNIGGEILIDSAVLGFFLPNQLAPGETLWMLATGAGLGPYISIMREGSVPLNYANVVIAHSVRFASELAYREEIEAYTKRYPGFCYVPIVTREPGATPLAKRIPELIEEGALDATARIPFESRTGRVMVCGNPDFTIDMRQLLTRRGFEPCRRGFTGSMLFEKYW